MNDMGMSKKCPRCKKIHNQRRYDLCSECKKEMGDKKVHIAIQKDNKIEK